MNTKPTYISGASSGKIKRLLISEYHRTKDQYENHPISLNNQPRTVTVEQQPPNQTIGNEESDPSSPLRVEDVSYDINNGKIHHTENFELMAPNTPTPIFRRGESFTLTVNLNRKFKPKDDVVNVLFSFGTNPSYSNGTKFHVSTTDEREVKREEWGMWIQESNSYKLSIKVQIPVTCQVGMWLYKINILSKDVKSTNKFRSDEYIFYVLFNPWCEYDEVYIEDEKERQKYIITDEDVLFKGTVAEPKTKEWLYGQFDYAVLPAIILLMENSDLLPNQRGSGVLMARAIAALINSADDFGLLVGNWDKKYTKGTHPELWTGSAAIFEQYLLNGGIPVKYGQCWVFAGCVTTACRALGIPCRSITCYMAAHDVDLNHTVDRHFDKNGKIVSNKQGVDDSIWNYHCWNEVWLARPDLDGYGGWQIIDATPQNLSDGKFRVGPAPRKAVREGDTGVNYDVDYVFSEVNADICWYREDPSNDSGYSKVKTDSRTIGVLIVTSKMDNSDDIGMDVLTEFYKYPETSEEERKIYQKAKSKIPKAQKQMVSKAQTPGDTKGNDVEFVVNKIPSIKQGDPFEISLILKNNSNEIRTADVSFEANVVAYTGKTLDEIKRFYTEMSVQPQTESTVSMQVGGKDYQEGVQHSSFIKTKVFCKVKETSQVFNHENVFEIGSPNLIIDAPGNAKKGVPLDVTFSFENPLDEELTNSSLIIEAPSMLRRKIMDLENVKPGGNFLKKISITPKKTGRTVVVGIFKSDQQALIKGTFHIEVKD